MRKSPHSQPVSTYKLLIFSAAAFSLCDLFANIRTLDADADADAIAGSSEDSGSRAQVQGKYLNPEFGIEISFPPGWKGSPSILEDNATLYLGLTKQSLSPELSAADLSSITLSAGKNLSYLDARLKENPLYENCKQLQVSNEVIGGKDFTVSSVDCPTIKYKTYHTEGPVLEVNVTYSALPSAFEAHLEDFDTSSHTLKIS